MVASREVRSRTVGVAAPSAHRLRQEIAIHEQRMMPIAPAEDQGRPRRPG
jgi:hypothetical protein